MSLSFTISSHSIFLSHLSSLYSFLLLLSPPSFLSGSSVEISFHVIFKLHAATLYPRSHPPTISPGGWGDRRSLPNNTDDVSCRLRHGRGQSSLMHRLPRLSNDQRIGIYRERTEKSQFSAPSSLFPFFSFSFFSFSSFFFSSKDAFARIADCQKL